MNKPRFKVGDLVYWRGLDEERGRRTYYNDVGLVVDAKGSAAFSSPHWQSSGRIKVLWLASPTPLRWWGEELDQVYNQQEWERRE